MKLELAQIVASAWPLGVSLAAAGALQAVYAGRRRSALNEAVHELRRPLQALAFAPGSGAGAAANSALSGSVQMAAAALERLEREINGESAAPVRALVEIQPLLAAAIGRWETHAQLAGARLQLSWRAGDLRVEGDRSTIAQAVDNLIVNAIEHGGAEIDVCGEVRSGRLLLAVRDSGRGSRRVAPQGEAAVPNSGPAVPNRSSAGPLARLLGRRRRGHGLRVVRRAAAEHGGGFRLRRSERGTEAVLDLPLRGGQG